MTRQSQRHALTTGEWIASKARSNPEGLLLLAAGAALLLRSGSSGGSGSARSNGDRARTGSGSQSQGGRAGDWPGAEQISRAGESARQYASDLGDKVSDLGDKVSDLGSTVSETASDYASTASRYVDEATRFASERSTEFISGARSTLQETTDRILRDQPLLVAVAGLAAGAAVAAAFPRTDVERRTLGPAGERLGEYASETAAQVKEAGMKAGERVMSAAQERGLSAEGLKEMAHEAAQAFGSAFSGKENQGGSASQTNQSGSSAKSGGSSGSSGGSGSGAGARGDNTTGSSVVAPETLKSPLGR